MNTDVIAECLDQSFADTPFPVVLQRLAGAGVRSYTADLVRLRTTYYGEGENAAEEALPLADRHAVADRFDGNDVQAAVRAIQRGEIGYAAFLRRIMDAGCARYAVYIGGGKAVYIGRDGAEYVEPFPRH